MTCEYGYTDCQNLGEKCYLCIDEFHYLPPKVNIKTPKRATSNGRIGSGAEAINHNKNIDLLSGASSRLTPNSGAGFVKGDEEIQGIINIMEEIKQKTTLDAKGKMNFTIQKDWLDKLDREGSEARKEFWYLKFNFKGDNHFYVITKDDIIMNMVYTMQEDRLNYKKVEKEIKKTKKSKELSDNKILSLEAKIRELETEIELLKIMNKNNI